MENSPAEGTSRASRFIFARSRARQTSPLREQKDHAGNKSSNQDRNRSAQLSSALMSEEPIRQENFLANGNKIPSIFRLLGNVLLLAVIHANPRFERELLIVPVY